MLQLSVIIPCYNVEQYISRCLESLLKQDLSQDLYEIVIIDDGSTDKTIELASGYAGTHANIKIVSQENQGVGIARNTGLSVAQGKYIWFVDADDWIKLDSLKTLIDTANDQNADLIRFEYKRVWEYTGNTPLVKEVGKKIVFGKTRMLRKKVKRKFFLFCHLLKRDLIIQHSISFPSIRMCEDVPFLAAYIRHAKKMVFVDIEIYFYFNRPGSLSNTFDLEHAMDILVAHEQMYNLLKTSETNWALNHYLNRVVMIRVIDVFRRSRSLSGEEKTYLVEYFKKSPLCKFPVIWLGISLRKIIAGYKIKYDPLKFLMSKE